jgi:hypothetical protein
MSKFASAATRRVEVLSLYRDIVRTCRRFNFANEKGEVWYVVVWLGSENFWFREAPQFFSLFLLHTCLIRASYRVV